MANAENPQDHLRDEIRQQIRASLYADETAIVQQLAKSANLDQGLRKAIGNRAEILVKNVRDSSDPVLMESFLTQYGLTTKEGVALMCLAEALLRVPDSETMDALIHDKIVPANWGTHLGQSSSSLVNASTWALMLTGRIIDEEEQDGVVGTLRGVVKRLGEPLIRTAVNQAIKELGNQFVLGESIDAAQENANEMVERGYTYSYDMLGEAALTDADAKRYHLAYSRAISLLAKRCTYQTVAENPGISVKLSALFPRYEFAQRDRVMVELVARTRSLAMLAKSANMGFNIDAEEADRLDLSLDVIEAVLREPSLADWQGFGIVVQAYSKRAAPVIDWLYNMSERLDRKIMIRLVKGAYWDSEIKRSQVEGLKGFPVFTRKSNTDISYISCARKLLSMTDRIYPQFATHNAHSVAAVLQMAGNDKEAFEFQRLHGMGEALHKEVHESEQTRCRIYAPVGAHEDLLAYLVRRLLENGANSSFVNQLVDETVSAAEIAADPFDTLDSDKALSHELIQIPAGVFQPQRVNSAGFDLTDPISIERLESARQKLRQNQWQAAPLLSSTEDVPPGAVIDIFNPADTSDRVGTCIQAQPKHVELALENAEKAWADWKDTPVKARAEALRKTANLMEAHSPELIELTCREAGKTLNDSVAEIREAVDFLRYYAAQAEALFDEHEVTALGTFICISPWNFPLAIFSGQIAAALAAGNCVIAKPAEQTPLVATRAVELFHEAGVKPAALQLLPGKGSSIGAALVADPRVAGVCFTGSTATAQRINRSMAETGRVDAPLIAETGGINAMMVDSTALPEQVVKDVVESAFQSAGQRCSALRILYLQSDIYERVSEMLIGAMQELTVGDPSRLDTDIGPVIDSSALSIITTHIKQYTESDALLFQPDLDSEKTGSGHFIAPVVITVDSIKDIRQEVFGPVLHLASFEAPDFFKVIEDINDSGYGLTFGFHTRVDERVQDVIDRIDAGNIYINRNQIGAVVGSQPFGGKKMSGTGPKAGGPHYLLRFVERIEQLTSSETASIPDNNNNSKPEPDTNQPAIKLQALANRINTLSEIHSQSSDALIATRIKAEKIVLQLEKSETFKFLADMDSTDLSTVKIKFEQSLTYLSSHLHETIDLPGVTGESNRLGLTPAGIFLCLHDGDYTNWALSIVSCLYTGNAVVAVGIDDNQLCDQIESAMFEQWKALGRTLPLTGINGQIDRDVIRTIDGISGVCVSRTKDARELRTALSERTGAILPLVLDASDVCSLVSEKSMCIDTTAAGGNATLLSQAS